MCRDLLSGWVHIPAAMTGMVDGRAAANGAARRDGDAAGRAIPFFCGFLFVCAHQRRDGNASHRRALGDGASALGFWGCDFGFTMIGGS